MQHATFAANQQRLPDQAWVGVDFGHVKWLEKDSGSSPMAELIDNTMTRPSLCHQKVVLVCKGNAEVILGSLTWGKDGEIQDREGGLDAWRGRPSGYDALAFCPNRISYQTSPIQCNLKFHSASYRGGHSRYGLLGMLGMRDIVTVHPKLRYYDATFATE